MRSKREKPRPREESRRERRRRSTRLPGGRARRRRRHALTRRAHRERGRREVREQRMRRCGLERSQLGELLVQSPVLFSQSFTATFQVLTVHFRLLKLCSESQSYIYKVKQNKNHVFELI